MKSQNIEGQSVAGQRSILANEVPLSTPYLVQIFPVYACNFKCCYCIHSIESEKRSFISDTKLMDFELFKKCIDDIKQFPQKIKMLRFAATGEPLLHKRLPEMIAYAKKADIAESIDVVSNGSLLTPELSDRLIGAGLSWLRISVQGVTSEKYKKVAGVDFTIETLVDNLRYFYENRGDTKLYAKTIDIDLSVDEKERFFSLFGDITDKIAIEYLSKATHHIDYTSISSRDLTTSQNGNPILNAEVCPQPFYMIQINPEGNIVPCCAMETAAVMGNVKEESILDIWRGEPLRDFRKMMLQKRRTDNKICATCVNFRHGMFKEDLLDEKADLLLQKIEK